MRKLSCLLFFFPAWINCQCQGIHFEDGMSWTQIKAKARAENMYIFLDCYATWCGPCKEMDRNIFPQKQVGDFFNSHFISVKIQVDKNPNDPSSVKEWYAEVDTLNKEYGIPAFPTYLFFSPGGVALHRLVGSTMEPEKFVAKASDALNSERQYYTIRNTWKNHLLDSVFLFNALAVVENAGDQQLANSIGQEYNKSVKDPSLNRETIELMSSLVKTVNDKQFQFFLDYAIQIDSVMAKKRYAENILAEIIYEEEMRPILSNSTLPVYWKEIVSNLKVKYPCKNPALLKTIEDKYANYIFTQTETRLFKEETTNVNWNKIASELKAIYPDFDCTQILFQVRKRYYPVKTGLEISHMVNDQNQVSPDWPNISIKMHSMFPGYNSEPILLEREIRYYAERNQWALTTEPLYILFRKYGQQFGDYLISENEASQLVWDCIFMHSADSKLLKEGLKYTWRLVDKTATDKIVVNDIDTYANLLYKMGSIKEAITWEKKALEIGEERKGKNWTSDSTEFQSNLEKMKKGEKTWAD